MQFTQSKKQVVAVAAGLAIAGSAAASAASLGGLTSVALGADSADVTSCDIDGVDVEFARSYDATSGEYVIDSVELSDIALECLARPYEFSIFEKGEGGARQAEGGAALTLVPYNRSTDGGIDMVGRKTFTVNFPAEDLQGVAMYIGGQQVGL